MSFILNDTLNLIQKSIMENESFDEFLGSNESCFERNTFFESDLNIFFNRLRKKLFMLMNSPTKISNIKYNCLELKYHVIKFLSEYIKLFDELNEIGESVDFDFSSLMKQISDFIIFIGNFSSLNEKLLSGFDVCQKNDDNEFSLVFHTILAIINCFYVLVFYMEKNQLLKNTSYHSILIFNGRKQSDKICLFNDMSYYLIYNLSVLNINLFQKKIDFNHNSLGIEKFIGFPCECIKQNWCFIENLLNYEKPTNFTNISAHVAILLKENTQTPLQNVSNRIHLKQNNTFFDIYLIMQLRCLAELNLVGKIKAFKDMISYENYKLVKAIIKDLSIKITDESIIRKEFFIILSAIYELTTHFNITTLGTKNIVDLLSFLWENYFCKQLNELRILDFNRLCLNEMKQQCYLIESLCSINNNYEFDHNTNLFHFYLKLLSMNIKDEQAWRLFKGRLYTRLHDKRIQELNLNAILNVSYLFLTMVRSIPIPIEPAQNLLRILNIFEETHLSEKKRILNSNNFQIKNYQINFIAKLTLLELVKKYLSEYNDDDSKTFFNDISLNLVNQINNVIQSHKSVLEESKRTLNYKGTQNENESLCEVFCCYLKNIQQFIACCNEKELDLYGLSLLEKFDVDYLATNLNKSQCESLFECMATLVESLQEKKSEKLTSYMTNFAQIVLKHLTKNQNSSSCFLIELYFQICTNLSNQSKTHILNDVIEKFFGTPSQTPNNSDYIFPILKLKFATKLLYNSNMTKLCKNIIPNFEQKLFSLALNYYLTHADDKNDILSKYLHALFNKLQLFNQFNIQFDSNIENIFTDFILKSSCRLKLIENFQARKQELDMFILCFQDFIKMINSLTTLTSHTCIYKCYLIASQIILNCSVFLHSRGRSDTLFAQIIDKMVLPRFMTCPVASNSSNSSSSVSLSNVQNSVWLALKDLLPLFLAGISNLNYEYDSYLQRVIKSIITNYTMKYQISQLDEHFIVLTITNTFGDVVAQEDKCFRNYLLRNLKEVFVQESKFNSDTEKVLGLLQLIFDKTELIEVIKNDMELFLQCLVTLVTNDNILLKSKAIILLETYLKNPNTITLNQCLEKFVVQNWQKQDITKVFSVLVMIAKTNLNILSNNLKQLISNKVLESQSKFIHNNDLKKVLNQFLELVDTNDDLKLKSELGI